MTLILSLRFTEKLFGSTFGVESTTISTGSGLELVLITAPTPISTIAIAMPIITADLIIICKTTKSINLF